MVLEKWFQLIFDHKVSLRERMFRVATGISMVAMTLTLIMGRNKVNLMLLAASLILMVVIVKFSIRKE